jgi:predicted phage terminase large subunit-like protein
MSDIDDMSLADIINLGAEDLLFFGRVFFPKTFKKASPEIHEACAELIDGPDNGQIAIFRGGAKTTLTRVACAKKASYGETSVTLVVGKGQDHAIKSILWLKNQIENNKKWADVFKITKALNQDTGRPKKWTDEWITIHNGVLDKEIHFIAYGITGQIRGMNIDDARPDFIICDDILDDENCATPEQREKIKERFWGALMKSLCRKEENPMAKCIMLQTPIDMEDLSMDIRKLKSWKTQIHSCFDAEGNSTWEEQFSTASLKAEKAEFIQLNKLSVWMREMEVNPTSSELRLFVPDWLGSYEQMPEGVWYIISVDPTPPPKDSKVERDPQKLDDAVVMVTGFHPQRKKFFVAEYYTTKSPQTMELVSKIFEFWVRYRPMHVVVETHLFQRTIKESLETHMQRTGTFFVITPIEDKRNKFVRIKDTLQGKASQGLIVIKDTHTELHSQFIAYPQVKHDDLLDALSLATMAVNPALLAVGTVIEGEYEDLGYVDDYSKALDYGGAP